MSSAVDIHSLTPMSKATMCWLNSQYNQKRRKELEEKRQKYIRTNIMIIYKNAIQLAETSSLTRITYLVTDTMTKIAYDIILELRRLFPECEVSCIRIPSNTSSNLIPEFEIDDETVKQGHIYGHPSMAPVYIVIDWS